MIKVERLDKPVELTVEVQRQLTEEFKKDKTKRVWSKSYIKRKLLQECNHKCIYCECAIGNGQSEMHIDHFHYKDKYVDEVVKWENLNPSCSRCNKNKSTHDTYEEPIINPFDQNPKDFFYIKNYRYYSRNDDVNKIVQNTIDVLGLNDTDKVVIFRFYQGEELNKKIQQIYDMATSNKDDLLKNVAKKNKVLIGCRNILSFGTKTAEYSAFMATIIKEDDNYLKLKKLLVDMNLWNDELQAMDEELDLLKMNTSRDT